MNENLLKAMGERLLLRRKQLRLTQEEVAEKADVTAQMISTAELGKKALRPENIVKLCNALDISADYLLTGNISDRDLDFLSQKIKSLTNEQYRHLEDMILSFLAVCKQ